MWNAVESRHAGAVVVACASVLGLAGCDSDALPPGTVRQTAELGSLPANVREAAKKALPDVTFKDAWENRDTKSRALHSYEIRGQNASGKTREVRVSSSGEILEME